MGNLSQSIGWLQATYTTGRGLIAGTGAKRAPDAGAVQGAFNGEHSIRGGFVRPLIWAISASNHDN